MRFISLLFGMSLMLTSCDGSNKNAKTPGSPRDRLKAALMITDASVRDSKLQQIAEDAYDVGVNEFVTVKEAVGKIADPTIQAEVANKIAMKLRDRDEIQMATEVAEAVSDRKARDALLAKIADR
jgi:hypothetical protein